jgi:nitrous oxide reductase accessory protein NosL
MIANLRETFGVYALVLSGVAMAFPAVACDSPPPGTSDRCPVCGMFVATHPNWIASTRFNDGTQVFFDGPKDLFRYVLDLETYRPGLTVDDIDEIEVTDYYTTDLIDARGAFFVVGTDVMGPMGPELVPTRTRDEAATLMKDHGGKKILAFEEVNVRELP